MGEARKTASRVDFDRSAKLFRQSVYSRLAGYEDANDAERLTVDPVMR